MCVRVRVCAWQLDYYVIYEVRLPGLANFVPSILIAHRDCAAGFAEAEAEAEALPEFGRVATLMQLRQLENPMPLAVLPNCVLATHLS